MESPASVLVRQLMTERDAMKTKLKALAQEMRAFKVYHAKDLEQVAQWADRLEQL
jgi:hypothetical protein